MLYPLTGDARPLRDWLTTFHLASVVIDPFTNESVWILDTAARVLHQFADAAVRVNFIVAGSPAEAKQFLGPLADQFLTFCDPERIMIKQLDLHELPAFVFIQSDGTVPASAEGWSPASWRLVANHIAQVVQWQQPLFPVASDPGSFKGTPALA